MITLELSEAVSLYTGVLAALAVGLLLFAELKVTKVQRSLGKQFVWHCVFCGYVYLDESSDRISQCPRCESFNSVADRHARETVPSRVALDAAAEDAAGGDPGKNTSKRKRHHQRRRGPRKRR